MKPIKETDDEKEIRIHNEMKIRPMPVKKENKDNIVLIYMCFYINKLDIILFFILIKNLILEKINLFNI